MSNLIGQSLGRYHILEQLGEGGMATVYKAYDTRLERDVAIKIIRRNAFPPEQLERILKRFEREAKALAKLSHPNIVGVIDYGEYDGAPYLVLVYLPGGTLKAQMTGKPILWQEAVRLLIPIASALDYAHEQKVIHRDVKPANILLTVKGQPMLSDFGIAKILEMEDGQTLTGTGMGVGTPEYMSPEQGMGKEVDGRADIYSLGIIFYELITGRKPYIADTPMAVILKHITDPLPRPRKFMPNLPDAVERVLLKALAKDPIDRYPDTGTFIAAMENLISGNYLRATASEQTVDTFADSLQTATDSGIGQKSPAYLNNTETTAETAEGQPSRKRSPNALWMGLGVIGIVLIGVLIGRLTRGNIPVEAPPASTPAYTTTPFTAQTPSPTNTSLSTNTPLFTNTPLSTDTPLFTNTPLVTATPELGIDGMILLYVPAGEFTMGSDNGEPDEKPVHKIKLDAFWIDQTEITNELFSSFIGATDYQTDAEKRGLSEVYNGIEWAKTNGANWLHPMGSGSDISSKDKHPVIHVSWNDAVAYCTWADRRLPTEAEWEKAARGKDERIYPWGNNAPNDKLLNFHKNIGGTTEVGNYPNGASPYGAYDMAGNVWEWVNDYYKSDYYAVLGNSASNPQGPSSSTGRGFRGGSWIDVEFYARTAYRDWDIPTGPDNYTGFRCARSAP